MKREFEIHGKGGGWYEAADNQWAVWLAPGRAIQHEPETHIGFAKNKRDAEAMVKKSELCACRYCAAKNSTTRKAVQA